MHLAWATRMVWSRFPRGGGEGRSLGRNKPVPSDRFMNFMPVCWFRQLLKRPHFYQMDREQCALPSYFPTPSLSFPF